MITPNDTQHSSHKPSLGTIRFSICGQMVHIFHIRHRTDQTYAFQIRSLVLIEIVLKHNIESSLGQACLAWEIRDFMSYQKRPEDVIQDLS